MSTLVIDRPRRDRRQAVTDEPLRYKSGDVVRMNATAAIAFGGAVTDALVVLRKTEAGPPYPYEGFEVVTGEGYLLDEAEVYAAGTLTDEEEVQVMRWRLKQ